MRVAPALLSKYRVPVLSRCPVSPLLLLTRESSVERNMNNLNEAEITDINESCCFMRILRKISKMTMGYTPNYELYKPLIALMNIVQFFEHCDKPN